MEPTLDSSLSHVLDPELQDVPLDATVTVSEPQGLPEHSGIVADTIKAAIELSPLPSPETPLTRQRKRPSATTPATRDNTPGSAVDLRRREANRLAAERSRGRQQEKMIALEMAVHALGDENLRLKEEIARLEGRSGMGSADMSGVGVPIDHSLLPQHDAAIAAVEAATAAAVAAADSAQAQQDSHSRNILAALISGAGVTSIDEALAAGLDVDTDGDATSWMQGVENLFKEAEASGRLGELAAVAANQGGEETPTGLRDSTVLGDVLGDSMRVGAPSTFSSSTAVATSAATASAVAVAINAEMEKALREDLAQTKSAIARVEREIAQLRGQPAYDDDISDTPFPSTLPDDIASADDASLAVRSTDVQSEISRLESEADVLREVVMRMNDARSAEENKLAGLVSELRALGMDGGERERERISSVLGSVRAHLSTTMGALDSSHTAAPFSSPAIARRRRGRPPKHSQPSLKPSFASSYSSALASEQASLDSHTETPSRAPIPRTRSRLAQEIRFSPEPSSSAASVVDEAANLSSQTAHANAHDDYLLSHLTGPTRDAAMALDSTAFAAFLPQSPEGQQQQHHPTLGESLAESSSSTHIQIHEDASHVVTERPNALSRLKRGPPGSCDICGRTETSVWRKLTLGGEDHKVCNACGLYHTKFGVIRPPELWGDGKSVKKRKASTRPSAIALNLGDSSFESPIAKRKRQSGKVDQQYDENGVPLDDIDDGGNDELEHTNGDGIDAAGMEGHNLVEGQSLGDVGRAVENMFAAVV